MKNLALSFTLIMIMLQMYGSSVYLSGQHTGDACGVQEADDITCFNKSTGKELKAAQFHISRGGLQISAGIFNRELKGRVAFLGGSITYNSGWRDSVCSFIKEYFPQATFEFINAGIPSFGSLPDAFRINRDVLAKGRIDLLFVEAAVNDRTNAYTGKEQIRAMEGIVRQARKANPATDIVIMYFVDPDKIHDYNNGIVPAEIINHEKVAEYYNIPSVNLAREVTERINNREFTWEDDFVDLHPSPFGQQVYYRSVSELLKACWERKTEELPVHYVIPAPLDPFCYENGKLIEVSGAFSTGGWIYEKEWKPQDKASTRDDYTNVPMLTATQPGKILTFTFTGTASGIAVAAGPDAGIIEYSMDGNEWKSLDLFTQWSGWLHLPWYVTLGDDLKYGSHTLHIRLSNSKNRESTGTACRIRYFYVN